MASNDDFTFCQIGLPADGDGLEVSMAVPDVSGVTIKDESASDASFNQSSGILWKDKLPSNGISKRETKIGLPADRDGLEVQKAVPDVSGVPIKDESASEASFNQSSGILWKDKLPSNDISKRETKVGSLSFSVIDTSPREKLTELPKQAAPEDTGNSVNSSRQQKTPGRKPAPRAKVPFEKGYSQMHWLKLTQTHPDLAGVRTPTRRSADMPSSSRARAAGAPSTSRAGTSRGGAGLVPPIPPTHHHAGWPDMPTELTGWRYGTSYPIPIEPPMPDHRYVRDPDSPPPPREYIDGMLGLVASLEGMVLRREAQLSILGFSMPPLHTGSQAGPSRPSQGARPSRPSRGAGRGESSRKRGGRRAHVIKEESSEEEEPAHPQSETSVDREGGSGSGSSSGDEVGEDPEDDNSDSDGDDGAEVVPQKRTKRASHSRN